jgi:hypothetical protein
MGSRAALAFAARAVYEPGLDCIVEVGSEHGDGSTAALAALAAERKVPFYSIDVDPAAVVAVAGIPGVSVICGDAAEVIADWTAERIRFAWLDGYDWPYSFFPGTPDQVAAYASRGQEITQEASQRSHLDISRHLDRLSPPGALAAFDDTWALPDGGWSGKGGTAIPFMLDTGWVVEDHSPAAVEPPADGWVLLRREAA